MTLCICKDTAVNQQQFVVLLISMWDLTHFYVGHGSFLCGT